MNRSSSRPPQPIDSTNTHRRPPFRRTKQISVSALKNICSKQKFQCSINDIMTCIVAGAVRKYIIHKRKPGEDKGAPVEPVRLVALSSLSSLSLWSSHLCSSVELSLSLSLSLVFSLSRLVFSVHLSISSLSLSFRLSIYLSISISISIWLSNNISLSLPHPHPLNPKPKAHRCRTRFNAKAADKKGTL